MKKKAFLDICPPHTFADSVKVNVNPGEKQIVKFRADSKGFFLYIYFFFYFYSFFYKGRGEYRY
jgi:hypothetical protein